MEPEDSHRHGGPVMVIEDWVQVEVDAEEAWRRLASAESWLPGCVLASYAEAETIRKRLDAPHPSWIPHAVTVLASPNHATAELATTDEREPRVLWEAGGVKAPSSRFEGKLTVRHIDPERAELQLRGVFRAPFQALQNDPALTEKLSRVTVGPRLGRWRRRSSRHRGPATAARSPGRADERPAAFRSGPGQPAAATPSWSNALSAEAAAPSYRGSRAPWGRARA